MYTAILLAGLVVAQPATDTDVPPDRLERVRTLLRELDDRELAVRERAEKSLVELGPEVLSLLPTPNNRMPAEMRQRLLRVRSALEQAAAEVSISESRITLQGDMSLADAMQALIEQSENQIVGFDARSEEQVKASFENTPFWVAFDQLVDQVQMRPDHFGGRPNTIVLVNRGESEKDRAVGAAYQGPFRIEGLRLIAARNLQNTDINGLHVGISIAWEPRLVPIAITHSLESLEAHDDRGARIGLGMGRVRDAPIHPGMTGVEMELPLELPDRGATKIASLKGTFTALVPSRAESFVFEDVGQARAVEQKRAGVTVILEDVRKNAALHQIRMRIRYDDASGALESHRGWIFSNDAYLLDPDGNRVDHAALETTRQSSNEVGVAYLFDRQEGLANCKFVYKTPAMIEQSEITYEINDLPLP